LRFLIAFTKTFVVERMDAILERKQSLRFSQRLSRFGSVFGLSDGIVQGLSSVYARKEKESAEDVVFDLFKIPNRNEACSRFVLKEKQGDDNLFRC